MFAGTGRSVENIDSDTIDDVAPLSMGFDSVYADSIPPEQRVTITTDPWTEEMFAPQYTPDDVGDFGDGLGEGSGRDDGEGWEKELTERTDMRRTPVNKALSATRRRSPVPATTSSTSICSDVTAILRSTARMAA